MFVIYLTTLHVLLVIVNFAAAEYQYVLNQSFFLLLYVYCVLILPHDGRSCPAYK